MFVDPRSVGDGATISTDVCVVGAGPAGITLAREFDGAGLDVCVLESGGTQTERGTQSLAAGETVGYPYFPLHTSRLRVLGGTANHWSVERGHRARPLDPLDFESRDGIPHSGWPLKRETLDPFYERAQRVCGLGRFDYDLSHWNADARPLAHGDVVAEMIQFGPSRSPFPAYFDGLGRSRNVKVYLRSTALEIVTAENPRLVSHLTVGRESGGRFFVAAKRYVLAAGGIENARLLLLGSRSRPAGLGNEHDLVGRFFMEHLAVRSGRLVVPPGAAVGDTTVYERHMSHGVPIMAMLRVREKKLRRAGMLNCLFFVLNRDEVFSLPAVRSLGVLKSALTHRPPPPRLLGHVGGVMRSAPDLVALGYRRLGRRRSARPATLYLRTTAEQAPNPASRVTLGAARDRFGLRVARLDWRLTELDHRSIRQAQDVLDGAWRAAGLGRLHDKLGEEDPPSLMEGQWHHIGTTRMHVDPKKGVVDENCRLHGVDNLFVAGSSVFPTSGASHPTLTVVALAVRLAGHIRAHLGER